MIGKLAGLLSTGASGVISAAGAFWNSDWTQNTLRDMKSIRILTKVAYTIFYFWLVAYCVKHNPNSMNTAITITGGILGTIIAGYMATKTYEKVTINGRR